MTVQRDARRPRADAWFRMKHARGGPPTSHSGVMQSDTHCRRARRHRSRAGAAVLLSATIIVPTARAQVDQAAAKQYFAEVDVLCRREGGQLWGRSLCGPLALVDVETRTQATNEPPPDVPPPPTFGYANTAIQWGKVRWSTAVWKMVPAADGHARRRLLIHELFHRIQPELGLLVPDQPNPHLDTLGGRYWLRLEWRALSRALSARGDDRLAAIADALAFRARRFELFPGAAESERRLQLNEGLAQYTGTVVAAPSRSAALADARDQLARAEDESTFIRVFPYSTGSAYGLLLDDSKPGWTRAITSADDVAGVVGTAVGVRPTSDADAAAQRYGASELRSYEAGRDVARSACLAQLRAHFVEGPVLVLPRTGKLEVSFVTTGMTPLPGVGTVSPTTRAAAAWGLLVADMALMGPETIAVPAPAQTTGPVITGAGWTLTLADGWVVRPGDRAGDFRVMRREP